MHKEVPSCHFPITYAPSAQLFPKTSNNENKLCTCRENSTKTGHKSTAFLQKWALLLWNPSWQRDLFLFVDSHPLQGRSRSEKGKKVVLFLRRSARQPWCFSGWVRDDKIISVLLAGNPLAAGWLKGVRLFNQWILFSSR